MCIMRNLSYHVHKEVPGAEKFQDPSSLQAPGSTGTHRKKKDDAGCFGGKKAKGLSSRVCYHQSVNYGKQYSPSGYRILNVLEML